MVKVHFNEKIETVETYDAGDYDRTSVPVAELNDDEFNEIECYRLEMKKQTIEEYQKRWKKSRNSTDSPVFESNSSNSDNETVSPTLKSCLIRKNSNISNKLNSSPISSSLEDDTSVFHEGQAQPNIVLNTPLSSDYNSDECRSSNLNIELSSSLESNAETHPNPHHYHLFTEIEKDISEVKEDNFENHHQAMVSPLSFNSVEIPVSDNDADIEENDEDNNSFIRLFEDSFEEKSVEEEDSDYIKDMSLTEGENSITLSHHVLSDDIPTTSFHSTTHRLFTDSLFNYSPILSEAPLEGKEQKSSNLQEEIDETVEKTHNLSLHEQLVDEPEEEEEEEEEEEKEDDDDEDDDLIDKHAHSDTYVNYGGTQHINIKPRRQNISNEYNGRSSCPFSKPISFLDDLPETFQSPLSSSLPSKNENSHFTTSNFFGSPFSPPSKSPYQNSSYNRSRASRFNSSSSYNSNNSGSNDGNYLVSKRNYLSLSGNCEPKSKSPSSSQHRLSHYTTSKWEGIGSRNSKSSKNNSTSNSNNNISSANKYYPRPATKLITNSPFSSSWIYDASF